MKEFVMAGILWTLAIYGLIEIIKTIIFEFTYTRRDTKGFYIIIAVKNAADKIEGILRPILFRNICEMGEITKDIIITDLGSTDETKAILNKLQKDYENVKILDWKDCKEVLEKE